MASDIIIKMKTETQIAEVYVEKINRKLENKKHPTKSKSNIHLFLTLAQEHKASCQRFLGFLEDISLYFGGFEYHEVGLRFEREINKKITDLKQAIKLYEDNGI